jgi:hypothetical protein
MLVVLLFSEQNCAKVCAMISEARLSSASCTKLSEGNLRICPTFLSVFLGNKEETKIVNQFTIVPRIGSSTCVPKKQRDSCAAEGKGLDGMMLPSPRESDTKRHCYQ